MKDDNRKMPETKGEESAKITEAPQSPPFPEKAAEFIESDLEKVQKELLYLRADFENYKKRILREQDQAIRFANEKLIHELLLPVDHLERALSHGGPLKSQGTEEVKNFIMGIEMTLTELTQLLGRCGVEFMGTIGDKFDPNRHEAISQKEVSDNKADTILEVVQRGSLLHGRLLRPARVVVGKKTPTH